jgi:hypothetical protein
VIARYLQTADADGSVSLSDRHDRQGDATLRVERITFRDGAGLETPSIATGAPLTVDLEYSSANGAPLRNVVVGLAFDTLLGQRVTQLNNEVEGTDLGNLPPEGTIRCVVPAVPFNAGRYHVTFFVTVGGTIADWVRKAVSLDVVTTDFYGSGRTLGAQDGVIVMPHAWTVEA